MHKNAKAILHWISIKEMESIIYGASNVPALVKEDLLHEADHPTPRDLPQMLDRHKEAISAMRPGTYD